MSVFMKFFGVLCGDWRMVDLDPRWIVMGNLKTVGELVPAEGFFIERFWREA